MRKREITTRLARRTRLPRAAAADKLDQVVHDLLTRLRRGQSVPLPGIGILKRDRSGAITLTPEES
jgi:nucleoid DNA-binding protein